MHCRSRSQPEFYLHSSLSNRNTATSMPESFDHVKEVTSKIMDGLYTKPNQHSQKLKEHMNFLESRLFAAHNHISKLEQKASEESWTDEKIHEISAAMKEYITDAEGKEVYLKTRIMQLEDEVCKLAKRDCENERIVENLKNDAARKLQEHKNELKKKIKSLETSLQTKDDELKRLKAQLNKSERKTSGLQEQNANLQMELNQNKVKCGEDVQQLKKLQQELNLQDQGLKNEVLRLTRSLHSSKLLEERFHEELTSTKKEIEEKNFRLQKLTSEMEALETVGTQHEKQIKVLEAEMKQANENEGRLLKNLQELEAEKQKNVESLNEAIKQTDQLKLSIQEMEKEKTSLGKTLRELEEENACLKYYSYEIRNEMSRLSAEYNEAINQNHLMKHQLEMKDVSSMNCNVVEEAVTKYINNHTAKVEDRLREDLRKLATELSLVTKGNAKVSPKQQSSQSSKFHLEKKTKEFIIKLKTMEEKLSRSNEEKIKLRKDCEYYAVQLEEHKKSLEESKQKIQEQNSIYFHCELQHQHQIQKIKELSDKMIDYEECKRENKTLTSELAQASAKLSDLQTASQPSKHTDELLEESQKLEKANMSVKDLEGKCFSLQRENEEYRATIAACENKITELQTEGHQMDSMFKKLKIFMSRTRSEINLLVKEYHKEEQRNKVLFEQIEKLKISSNDEERKMVKYKEQAERTNNQLKEMEIQCNDLTKSKADMQNLLDEKETELVTIFNINQQLDWIVKDAKTLIDNLQDDLLIKTREVECLKKQASEQRNILQKMQRNYMTEFQNFEQEKLKYDHIENAYNSLQNEIGKREGELQSCQQKITSLVNAQTVYKGKVEEAEENMDVVYKENRKLKEDLKSINSINQDISVRLKVLQVEHEELESIKLQLLNKITCLSNQLSTNSEKETISRTEREQLEEKLREMKCQSKEMISELAGNKECIEKLKSENKELTSNMQILNKKLEKYNEEIQSRCLSVKEFQSENQRLKQTCQSKEEKIGSLKSKLSELQGLVEGRTHKQNWIVQHGQDQLNEINILKQKNKELEEEKLRLKEAKIRADIMCEKLSEDIRNKEKDLNTSLRAADNAEKELHRLSKSNKEQVSLLKQNLMQLTLKEEKTNHVIDSIESEKKDMIKKIQENDLRMKNLIEKHEETLKDVKRYKMEIVKLLDQKEHDDSRLKDFKEEFFKLVQLLKHMKKERDWLKTIFSTNEEECHKFQTVNHRLRTDMNKLKQNLLECTQERKQAQSENETLKSKLNILKFTESARDVERKEMLEKLKECEKQLKAKESLKTTTTSDNKKFVEVEGTTTATFPGYHGELIFNLQKALSEKVTQNIVSPEIQSMKEFLKMIEERGCSYRPNNPPCCVGNIRKTIKSKRHRPKSSRKTMVENLFRESYTLQKTLLDEISTISNKVLFESYPLL